MSALWIDAPTGLAGDMLLAALLDLGVDQAVVESPLAALGLAGRYRISQQEARSGGLRGIRVDVQGLYLTVNLPRINQVYLLFRARLLDLDFSAGEESLEVALFAPEQVPWKELAFPTVAVALEHFFKDQERGSFTQRMADIERDQTHPLGYRVNLIET